ncbi:short-chain dehydrogenase [Actinomadura sp. CNU-125]|uniref:SDR family oxidoreductase n=1 Tax=Actinomadura sp. CNU-125 TaxID=1904961 RepID=UPI0009664347|nr:SDR family oxidoreductase [Actinomadura sp. CNU-125]OLT33920.1 short-chain dehydrogenase [Actinomadura sp. CNU-125]
MSFPQLLLEGRTVLVAGAGPGLGRALALRSALAGADVVLAARSADRLNALAEEVTDLGRRALVVPTDLADDASIARLADTAVREMGRLDAVVYNANMQPPHESLVDGDMDAARSTADVNVWGALNLTRRLTPALRETKGSVVMVNSMVLYNRRPRFGAYRMMKAALLACARGLSVDLGPMGIRVNTVAPGYIWADKVQAHFERLAASRGMTPEEVYAEVAAETDLRRLPEPEAIADAVVFLFSDMARAITGQSINVDCGQTHH